MQIPQKRPSQPRDPEPSCCELTVLTIAQWCVHYLVYMHNKAKTLVKNWLKHAWGIHKNKDALQYLVLSNTRCSVVFLCSGILALIEASTQLQIVEPYLQECVDITCCTKVGQANKCVLEGGIERHRITCINTLLLHKAKLPTINLQTRMHFNFKKKSVRK